MDKRINNMPAAGEEAKRAYVYTGYSRRDHKMLGSPADWDDRRVEAVLAEERRQEAVHYIVESVIFALFGAMLVFAYYS